MFYASFIYLLAVISPGPNFILVSRYSSLGSLWQGFAVTLGICTVSVLFATISLLGLASVLRSFPYFTDISVILGACYLTLIAVSIVLGTLRIEQTGNEAAPAAEKIEFRFFKSYWIGALTNLFNMKTIAFMISIFSGFLATPRSSFEQISIVAICSALEFFWYFLVAFVFGGTFVKSLFCRHRILIDR